VALVAERVAELRGESLASLAISSSANAMTLFGLKLEMV
jgi:Tat protein secretion system quality control protein TatD with DNase activity